MKYLDKNLTKETKDPYIENYKTLLRKIKDLNKWRAVPCSWVGGPSIAKI